MPSPTITPTEARDQLNWLRGCTDVGTEARKSELRRVLAAADEVEETDPGKMLKTADWLERIAAEHEANGKAHQAEENREIAARYRRCAARAMAPANTLHPIFADILKPRRAAA
ncbi:hypothetical protein [Brevundimonas sp.]|uniref:hypothetical protein n=1 Tax=Brevundimonas sp. TaxID=1871086 RepID=UPI002D46B78B|nr:hypothetical protein [Brevundimonas sp.]HYC66673.1 hypothetical protein [Brevundimonas sp.]